MKHNFFYTCFCLTSVTLFLNSCKNPETPRAQSVSYTVIANRAAEAINTSFASHPASTQTSEQNLIVVKADKGGEVTIDELKNAIKLADDIDREVHQSLNTNILNKAYTGVELQKKQAFINELKSNNVYIYSRLRKQEFKNFQISTDGATAKVDLIETWSHKIFSHKTNELLAKSPPTNVPQTNYLQKTKKGWLVYKTVFKTNPPSFQVLTKS